MSGALDVARLAGLFLQVIARNRAALTPRIVGGTIAAAFLVIGLHQPLVVALLVSWIGAGGAPLAHFGVGRNESHPALPVTAAQRRLAAWLVLAGIDVATVGLLSLAWFGVELPASVFVVCALAALVEARRKYATHATTSVSGRTSRV